MRRDAVDWSNCGDYDPVLAGDATNHGDGEYQHVDANLVRKIAGTRGHAARGGFGPGARCGENELRHQVAARICRTMLEPVDSGGCGVCRDVGTARFGGRPAV